MEENLYDDRLAGFVSKERYDEKRQQLASKAMEMSKRLAMLREAQDATVSVEAVPEYDNPIVGLFAKGTPHQKRIIMSLLFKKITYKNGVLSLHLSKDISAT